jgi:uncharacterized protein
MEFRVIAWGHENVSCLHEKTLEFTAEKHLTERGDCILAVSAEKTMADLPDEFKNALSAGAKITIKIKCQGVEDEVRAFGCVGLTLSHKTDFVVRKSRFICPRTLAVSADKAASELKRELVEKLKQKNKTEITLKI